jgi:transcriptional repressor NF-X1
MPLTFDIEFVPSGEVLLKAISRTLSDSELRDHLQNIKASVISAISAKGYGSAELCATDSSLNIIKRESDNSSKDGWSQVAAKKAASKMTVTNTKSTERNIYSALSNNKVTFAKKKPEIIKPKKEVVVDDWEVAESAEEEKEKAASAAASGDEDAGTPHIDELNSWPMAKSETAAHDQRLEQGENDLAGHSVIPNEAVELEHAIPGHAEEA